MNQVVGFSGALCSNTLVQTNEIDVLDEVQKAYPRIREHIRETPLEHSPFLSDASGADVYLKLENQQISGSFKLRGALNKCLALTKEQRAKPVVTASSGNHAAAVAYSLHELGARGIIYLPEAVSPAKVEALAPYGMELRFVAGDSVLGELQAKATAETEGLTFVSPYNDARVIGGQGTIGIELEKQLEHVDAVFVPVGGGGLIGGIAGYLKTRNPRVRVIGCQPLHSCVMYESVKAGYIVEMESRPTLADGTAGGVEPGSITFPLCQRYVDDFALVEEEQIAEALRLIVEKHYQLIEGASALSVAGFLASGDAYRNQTVVLVLTGKKISLETLKHVLAVS